MGVSAVVLDTEQLIAVLASMLAIGSNLEQPGLDGILVCTAQLTTMLALDSDRIAEAAMAIVKTARRQAAAPNN